MSKTREMLIARMRCYTEQYERQIEDGYVELENWSLDADMEFLRGMLHAGHHFEHIDGNEYGFCLRLIVRYEQFARNKFGF